MAARQPGGRRQQQQAGHGLIVTDLRRRRRQSNVQQHNTAQHTGTGTSVVRRLMSAVGSRGSFTLHTHCTASKYNAPRRHTAHPYPVGYVVFGSGCDVRRTGLWGVNTAVYI